LIAAFVQNDGLDAVMSTMTERSWTDACTYNATI